MAGHRIRPLTAADLPRLPEPCARCTFWQVGRNHLATPSDEDKINIKLEWAEAVTRQWGHCGVQAVNDGETIGFLTMAPAAYVPRLGAFATTPVSGDAAVILSVRVLEAYRGRGVGKHLVQAAAALMVRRDIRALEAIGSYQRGPSCLLPGAFLEQVGFTVVRQHPVTPRFRMDLQSTLRWSDLGAAWHKLTGLVAAPAPPPEPASRTQRGSLVPDARP